MAPGKPSSRPTQEQPKLASSHLITARRTVMSKGMDSKKTDKKKPAKTLKEKRAAKHDKKKDK